MPALTIDGTEYAATSWVETDEYPADLSEGFDRSRASPVMPGRAQSRTIQYQSPLMDYEDAVTLEALLTSGPILLDGDLPGEELTAVAHDVVLLPDTETTLYASVSCTFWIDV